MKEEIVGLNHLELIISLLTRSNNLLNSGKDIYPFQKWRDGMSDIIDDIKDYIAEEKK